LAKEKDHIEGFAPEAAWVTRAGQSDLRTNRYQTYFRDGYVPLLRQMDPFPPRPTTKIKPMEQRSQMGI